MLKLADVFCMVCPQFTHKIQEMPLQKKTHQKTKKNNKTKPARTEQSERTSQLKQQDYALRA